MMSLLIVICVSMLAFGIVYRYGLRGIAAAVGLLASDTDSAGIMYWIINYVPFYKVPVRIIVIAGAAIGAYRVMINDLFSRSNRSFLYFYFLPLLLLSAMIVLLNLARGQGLVIGFSEVIWLGTPFFFLWIAGTFRKRTGDLFRFYVFVQGLVALLILLFGAITSEINGAAYASRIGGEGWVIDPRDIIGAPLSFFNFNKHDLSVMKFGQFHNPNSLGVYASMLIVVSLYGFMKSLNPQCKRFYTFIWAFGALVGTVLWLNSLTRGPILLLALWGIFGFLHRAKRRPYGLLAILLSIAIIVFMFMDINQLAVLRFLVVQPDDVSVVSRLSGYEFAFNAIVNSPFVGKAVSVSDPVPHILTLKIAAYYGIPAALLATIPFIHAGCKIIEKIRRDHLIMNSLDFNYTVGLLCIVVGAFTTNGVVAYVLFWIAFAEVVLRLDLYTSKAMGSSK